MTDQPTRTRRVVVIGGGIIGTSVAYHLTALGWTDLVLLEQGSLSGGTTWHAAGLVGLMRSTENGTRLVQYSADLYSRLEAETGLATGYKHCGGVTVARTPERMVQLRRTVATAEAFDLRCELISPARAKELYPMLETEDLLGAIWLPDDGTANPTDVTQSLARGARQRGARILEHTRVTDIITRDGRATGVRTDQGDIEAEVVVNCAGQWAKAVGAHVRGHRAAALGRALLRRHRADRGHPPRPADPARPGRLHLLQGRGRRPGRRRFRAPGQALGGAGPAPLSLRVPAPRGGLGPLLGPDGVCAATDSGPAPHRDQEVLQRAGELHARQPVHHRRGPRAAQLLRRRGVQLGRHRHRRRRRTGAGRVDRGRRAHQRRLRDGHPPVRRLQRQQPLVARPRGRDPRAALRGAVAGP